MAIDGGSGEEDESRLRGKGNCKEKAVEIWRTVAYLYRSSYEIQAPPWRAYDLSPLDVPRLPFRHFASAVCVFFANIPVHSLWSDDGAAYPMTCNSQRWLFLGGTSRMVRSQKVKSWGGKGGEWR